MPVITVSMPNASKEQKKELIAQLTSTAVNVMGIPAQSFTVILNERPLDSMGVGGIIVEELIKNHG